MNSVEIAPASSVWGPEIEYLLRNLRPSDYHEFVSVGAVPEVEGLRLLRSVDDGHVALLRGVPVFAFGTAPMWPHVRQVFGFGTPDTPKVIPAVTRFARQWTMPGVTRLEVRVPASCVHSIAWLKSAFGATEEAVLHGYSIFGEPYIQLSREITP